MWAHGRKFACNTEQDRVSEAETPETMPLRASGARRLQGQTVVGPQRQHCVQGVISASTR